MRNVKQYYIVCLPYNHSIIFDQPRIVMRKDRHEEKLFKNELNTYNHYREWSAEYRSPEENSVALNSLTQKYKALLEQTRFLTWISGRLERKLQRTNRELFEKNNKLEKTLYELTKAEASRSAYAIIYFVTIVLFVLEEFFVEPVIDVMGDGNNLGFSIAIKLSIVILLKLAESVIERRITKKPKINFEQ